MEKTIKEIIEMYKLGIIDSKTAGEMFANLLEESDG